MLATLAAVCVVVVSLVKPASPARRVLEIGPDSDFCAWLRTLKPGEELVLRPGDYQGPCAIRRGGAPGSPVVLRAADPQHRPRLVYQGSSSNVLEVRASHVTISGLEFGPTLPDVDGIRVFEVDEVTVEACRFSELGGIAVVANHANVRGLVVRRNEIISSRTTAMYFGCHDGRGCATSDLVVERNYIQGTTAPDPQIGYGMQLKLNTTGIIRDNVIVDTKGPGIMVYGALDAGHVSLIERNLVIGSHQSSGIVVGGGPVTVRNNIAIKNAQAGIGLEDYGKRGLLRGVVLIHNTIYQNGLAGILAPTHDPLEAIVANNVVAGNHAAALPSPRRGLRLAGNVDCSSAVCFLGPERGDFTAIAGSRLGSATGAPGLDALSPNDDFFGMPRSVPPMVGAVERGGGPVRLGIKP